MRKPAKKATMRGGIVTADWRESKEVARQAKAMRKNAKERQRRRPLTDRVVSSGKVAAGDMDFHHRTKAIPSGVYFRVARTDVDSRVATVVVQRWSRETDSAVRGSRPYRMRETTYSIAKSLAAVSPVTTYQRTDTSAVYWLSPRNWSRLQRRLAKPIDLTKRDDAAVIRRRQAAKDVKAVAHESASTREAERLAALPYQVFGRRFNSFAALASAVKEAR